MIQENEVRLGSGIFVVGNRGSAALEPSSLSDLAGGFFCRLFE